MMPQWRSLYETRFFTIPVNGLICPTLSCCVAPPVSRQLEALSLEAELEGNVALSTPPPIERSIMTARAIRSMLSLASSLTERALVGLELLFVGSTVLSMLSLGVHTGGSAPAILATATVLVVAVALEGAAVGCLQSAETVESVDSGASTVTTGTTALPLPFLVLGAFAAGGCTSVDVL